MLLLSFSICINAVMHIHDHGVVFYLIFVTAFSLILLISACLFYSLLTFLTHCVSYLFKLYMQLYATNKQSLEMRIEESLGWFMKWTTYAALEGKYWNNVRLISIKCRCYWYAVFGYVGTRAAELCVLGLTLAFMSISRGVLEIFSWYDNFSCCSYIILSFVVVNDGIDTGWMYKYCFVLYTIFIILSLFIHRRKTGWDVVIPLLSSVLWQS